MKTEVKILDALDWSVRAGNGSDFSFHHSDKKNCFNTEVTLTTTTSTQTATTTC